MRIIPCIVALLYMAPSMAQQTGSFTDPRDGNQYATVTIGNKIWFRENLRYHTVTSFCPNFSKDSLACAKGNYYLNSEVGKVCPPGWNVPTREDWMAYVDELIRLKRLDRDSISIKTMPPPNNSVMHLLKGFSIMNDPLLKFDPIGWVEGNKVANTSNISIWITDNTSNDDKYHIHMSKEGFVTHTHKHHVIDRPKKIRKFTIRCVCDVKQ
jgi:uncharacterized protein (TIGR02145 family)